MKRKVISIFIILMLTLFILSGCDSHEVDSVDEGTATIVETSVWKDSSNNEHKVSLLTNGKTAQLVLNESKEITLNHKTVDEIPIYEMYSSHNNGKIIFFFHGQGSRKEEYLFEMVNYVDSGYLCVTVDLEGHGERVISDTVMSVQATVDTAKDIDTLLDYYDTQSYAKTETFALVGLSQGGSVSYWYAAYGERTPSALVIGSSTPDYQYQNDDTALQNGKIVDSIWSEDEINAYIYTNNPINNVERFIDIPILSGNGLDDSVISYKGAEALEQMIVKHGNAHSQFYYFENVGHDVTEDFMSRVLPFLNENM